MQHPTTPREALTVVAELFADPSRWLSSDHHPADTVDAAGARVDPLSPAAVAWTLDGALARVVAADAVDQFDDYPEWSRRIEVELGAYRALGIEPGHEFRQRGKALAMVRQALAA